MFLGTYFGHILLYDSNTFGLLCDLTAYDDSFCESFGAVVGVSYSQRDHILIVLYSNGALKAFNGLFRNPVEDDVSVAVASEADIKRHPPAKPILLRSLNYTITKDNTINQLAFSEDINAIAVGSMYGMIWIFDYSTFILQNVFSLPGSLLSDIRLSDMIFLDRLPILSTCDSSGYVTLWRTFPQQPLWLFSWLPHSSPWSPDASSQGKDYIEASGQLVLLKTHMLSTKLSEASLASPAFKSPQQRIPGISRIAVDSNAISRRVFDFNSPKSLNVNNNGSNLGFNQSFYLYIVNEYGRVIVQDVTKVLEKAPNNLLGRLYYRERGDMTVYTVATRDSLTDGCKSSGILESVDSMIKEPIGIHINHFTVSPYGIAVRDVVTTRHWRVKGNESINNMTFIPTSSEKEPYIIAIATDDGGLLNVLMNTSLISGFIEVHLFSWNGISFYGRWIHSDPIHIRNKNTDEEDEEDLHDKRRISTKQDSNHPRLEDRGWTIPRGLLTFQNSYQKNQSTHEAGGGTFVQVNSPWDWVAFLEDVHRKASAPNISSYNRKTIMFKMSTPVHQSASNIDSSELMSPLFPSFQTPKMKKTVKVNSPVNADGDVKDVSDYKEWKDVLTMNTDAATAVQRRMSVMIDSTIDQHDPYGINRVLQARSERKVQELINKRRSKSTRSATLVRTVRLAINASKSFEREMRDDDGQGTPATQRRRSVRSRGSVSTQFDDDMTIASPIPSTMSRQQSYASVVSTQTDTSAKSAIDEIIDLFPTKLTSVHDRLSMNKKPVNANRPMSAPASRVTLSIDTGAQANSSPPPSNRPQDDSRWSRVQETLDKYRDMDKRHDLPWSPRLRRLDDTALTARSIQTPHKR